MDRPKPLIVVYDACVLYPAPLRSLLMYVTLADVCDARWTDRIHDEWTRNVLANRPDLTVAQIGRTRELMDRHASHAKVAGYEPLIDALTLPDPDDRHVLAAAIHARASVIVTFNLRDFPDAECSPHGVVARHPDAFLCERFDANAPAIRLAADRHRRSMRQPAVTAEEYLAMIERQQLPGTAARLRRAA